jgi:DNA-binding LytR/AlgR family response regulator
MARMAMKQLVSQANDLELIAECENAINAWNILQKEKIDLILLDIEMKGMSGIELTQKLKDRSTLIIFTTAKTEYAVEAFELNVIDYLVKPVSPARFLQAIARAKDTVESNKQVLNIEGKEFVFVRDNGVLKKISIEDILFLEAMGDYVKIHTAQKFHIVHTTLKSIEGKLPAGKFLRVHRSYIVAINKIDFVEEGVINIGKIAVPVADAYRSLLNQRLNLL